MTAAFPLAGFLLWCAMSAWGLAASWALGCALLRGRGLTDRAQACILVGLALVLSAVQALGLLHALDRPRLCGLAALLFAGAGAAALELLGRAVVPRAAGARERWGAGLAELAALTRDDLRAPLRVYREAWADREPALLGVLAGLGPLAVAAVLVWVLHSWAWDSIWYHVPIVKLAVQEKGLGYVETHNIRLLGFPRNVELLDVWNLLLVRRNLLDDAAQLPFAPLGVLALASIFRELGASRPLAAGAAALWLLAPPVAVQMPTLLIDVACGALLLCAWRWLLAPRFGPVERGLAALALALYLGAKFSGAFHALLLAPVFLVRWFLDGRRAAREGRAVPALPSEILALAALALWLGGVTYVRNLALHGNPLWPVRFALPFLGELPGASPRRDIVGGSLFFGDAGSFTHMVVSWWERPTGIPDPRTGGFGALFRWLTLPCLVVVIADALRGRELRKALVVLGLFAVAVVVPDPWWPRYCLAAAGAALGALVLVHGTLSGWISRGLSLVAVALGVFGWIDGFHGYSPLDGGYFGEALGASQFERAVLPHQPWMWPRAVAEMRESDLKAGEAVAYDDSINFLDELWTADLRNRVVYVQHAADKRTPWPPRKPLGALAAADAAYLEALRGQRSAWVIARNGGRAEALVSSLGSQRLLVCPWSQGSLWRLPAAFREPALAAGPGR